MKIDRQHIIDLLRNRGDHDKADRAQSELPEQVDTDQHADKLSQLGVDIRNLGAGAGGLGDSL
jgi:hypothetical protein